MREVEKFEPVMSISIGGKIHLITKEKGKTDCGILILHSDNHLHVYSEMQVCNIPFQVSCETCGKYFNADSIPKGIISTIKYKGVTHLQNFAIHKTDCGINFPSRGRHRQSAKAFYFNDLDEVLDKVVDCKECKK